VSISEHPSRLGIVVVLATQGFLYRSPVKRFQYKLRAEKKQMVFEVSCNASLTAGNRSPVILTADKMTALPTNSEALQ
jgi:hypothetical protein